MCVCVCVFVCVCLCVRLCVCVENDRVGQRLRNNITQVDTIYMEHYGYPDPNHFQMVCVLPSLIKERILRNHTNKVKP